MQWSYQAASTHTLAMTPQQLLPAHSNGWLGHSGQPCSPFPWLRAPEAAPLHTTLPQPAGQAGSLSHKAQAVQEGTAPSRDLCQFREHDGNRCEGCASFGLNHLVGNHTLNTWDIIFYLFLTKKLNLTASKGTNLSSQTLMLSVS